MHVLLLHGWNLSAKYYSSVAGDLSAKGYRVIVPDLPGFGHASELETPWKLDDYVAYVRKILKKRNVTTVIPIGHSFGGRIALRLTARYPHIVDKLVLTGVPGYPAESDIQKKMLKHTATVGNKVLSIPGLQKSKHHAKKLLYKIAGTTDYQKTSGVLRDTFVNIVNQELESSMKQISHKTLLIWGEHDTITPRWIGERMEQTMRNASLVVLPEADHSVIYKKPNVFLNHLLPFLK